MPGFVLMSCTFRLAEKRKEEVTPLMTSDWFPWKSISHQSNEKECNYLIRKVKLLPEIRLRSLIWQNKLPLSLNFIEISHMCLFSFNINCIQNQLFFIPREHASFHYIIKSSHLEWDIKWRTIPAFQQYQYCRISRTICLNGIISPLLLTIIFQKKKWLVWSVTLISWCKKFFTQ